MILSKDMICKIYFFFIANPLQPFNSHRQQYDLSDAESRLDTVPGQDDPFPGAHQIHPRMLGQRINRRSRYNLFRQNLLRIRLADCQLQKIATSFGGPTLDQTGHKVLGLVFAQRHFHPEMVIVQSQNQRTIGQRCAWRQIDHGRRLTDGDHGDLVEVGDVSLDLVAFHFLVARITAGTAEVLVDGAGGNLEADMIVGDVVETFCGYVLGLWSTSSEECL